MKIGVYGISCAGKDTFITQLLISPLLEKFSHFKGSVILNELAKEKHSVGFKNLSEQGKTSIRKSFVDSLKEKDNFIVDGHYCFPNMDKINFDIVFTDSDLTLYDCFIYLKGNADVIKERLQKSTKNQKFAGLTAEQIHQWQIFEISQLREKCFSSAKDFIILDDDFSDGAVFLSDYIQTYPNKSSFSSAVKITAEITSDKVALFDCDRTITLEDTTIPFFQLNNENESSLKSIFADDAYSSYQFWKQAKLYDKFSVYPNISTFHLNKIVIDKLVKLKNQGYAVYGLTSGVFRIWQELNDTYNLFDAVIGNDLSENNFIISDFVKGYVAKILKEKGCTVVSAGDSMCDIFMLDESNEGFIYTPNKLRPLVQNYFDTHSGTHIKQFSKNPFQYNGINSEE